MTVQQLKYILKVAEVGSITEAAKMLFISQPSLSNSIKETEKEAGITIFLRSRTGITLTKDGAEFLGYARQVIQQMELLEDRYVTNLLSQIRRFYSTLVHRLQQSHPDSQERNGMKSHLFGIKACKSIFFPLIY